MLSRKQLCVMISPKHFVNAVAVPHLGPFSAASDTLFEIFGLTVKTLLLVHFGAAPAK